MFRLRFCSVAGGCSGVDGGVAFNVASPAASADDASAVSSRDYGCPHVLGLLTH